MSLIAVLKDIESKGMGGILPVERTTMVDGSLSEIITQALNVANTRKDFYTGKPFYGQANPGVQEEGGGTLMDYTKADELRNEGNPRRPRPSLETQATDQTALLEAVGALGEDIIDANDESQVDALQEQPIMVYALPEDGKIPEEMNEKVESYIDSGAMDVRDFVFVYTGDAKVNGDYKVVDVNQKVKDYEKAGAHVYPDLQSFLVALPDLRKRF